jgi:hypothetical protein
VRVFQPLLQQILFACAMNFDQLGVTPSGVLGPAACPIDQQIHFASESRERRHFRLAMLI